MHEKGKQRWKQVCAIRHWQYTNRLLYFIKLNCCTESRIVANDDDEDEENDYEDSFINDERKSSSCEPSEHDSDWHESDEEISDENVDELLAEARGFARNKKKLKPSWKVRFVR